MQSGSMRPKGMLAILQIAIKKLNAFTQMHKQNATAIPLNDNYHQQTSVWVYQVDDCYRDALGMESYQQYSRAKKHKTLINKKFKC